MSKRLTDLANERAETDFRDMELEYQLAAYLVRKNPKAVSVVRREWFSDELLQDVFDVLGDRPEKMTAATLRRRMCERFKNEDPGLIKECVEDVFLADIDDIEEGGGMLVAESVMRLYESRNMINTMADLLGNLKKWDLDRAKRIIAEIARPAQVLGDTDEGYYLDDYDSRQEIIDERSKQEIVGIPTGVYEFDDMCGGVLPGEFGVIAGVTGVGKTAGLIDLGINAWSLGKNAVIVSGEMGKDELGFRIDTNLSTIPGMKFRKGDLSDEQIEDWAATISQYRDTSDSFLYIVSFAREFTAESIETVILRLQEDTGEKVHWLGIDYINIMSSKRSRGDDRDWTSQANSVWDVKDLTLRHGLVTWTAGQVKDEAYEKELYELSDLKYARAISEAAPIVIALIRSDTDILANRMKLQVLKMRNAVVPARPMVLHPDLEVMKINAAPPMGLKNLEDLGKRGRMKNLRQKKHTAAAKDKRRETSRRAK